MCTQGNRTSQPHMSLVYWHSCKTLSWSSRDATQVCTRLACRVLLEARIQLASRLSSARQYHPHIFQMDRYQIRCSSSCRKHNAERYCSTGVKQLSLAGCLCLLQRSCHPSFASVLLTTAPYKGVSTCNRCGLLPSLELACGPSCRKIL